MEFEENTEDFENSGQNPKALLVQRIYARTCNFLSGLKGKLASETSLSGTADGDDAFEKYLNLCYTLGEDGKCITGVKNPVLIDFNGDGFESINREKVVDIKKESKRSLIVLEFFTHCCINCIHSIEDIRQVYEDLKNSNQDGFDSKEAIRLKVVSVHSPKFAREKEHESIKAFTKRMQMDYSDVINDPDSKLWNELGICCWPTVLVFGPNPTGSELNLLFTFMGEGHKDDLKRVLESSLKYLDKKFNFEDSLNLRDEGDVMTDAVDGAGGEKTRTLRFPGKVTYYGGLLGISDSGNNRIVIADKDNRVQYIVGGLNRGCVDGDFDSARFYNPQGLVFQNENVVFVADTGNHAIRRIDIGSKTVSTLVPPDFTSQVGDETAMLKSPWDLFFLSESVLLIAAAGNHRIFGYFFDDVNLFSSSHTAGTCTVIAGSGREENRNNSYILKASFAQPSGICVTSDPSGMKTIYVADSESSSVRSISSGGKVTGVVGGARDPTDLFAYGDSDGKGFDTKLQHPMGVCCLAANDQNIFVADTYNHKVKVIELGTKQCKTIIGDGKAGNTAGLFSSENNRLEIAQLNEPGGIAANDDIGCLVIADTNNHDIKFANMNTRIVESIKLDFSHLKHQKKLFTEPSNFNLKQEINHPSDKIPAKIQVTIDGIPENFEGGSWKIEPIKNKWNETIRGNLIKDSGSSKGSYCICLPGELLTFREYVVTTDVFLCGESSCFKRTLKFLLYVSLTATNELYGFTQNDEHEIVHSINYSNPDIFK